MNCSAHNLDLKDRSTTKDQCVFTGVIFFILKLFTNNWSVKKRLFY